MRATDLLCKYFVTGARLAFCMRGAMMLPSPSPMETSTQAIPAPAPAVVRHDNEALYFIGIYKAIKTVLFLIAAVGIHHMVHRDTQVELTRFLHVFRVSGDGRIVKNLLLKANVIDDPRKKIITYVLVFYALLFATEGTGLLLRKRWGEWFTSLATASGIPIEIYVLMHHATNPKIAPLVAAGGHSPPLVLDRLEMFKIAALVINVLIVWYLVAHLIRTSRVPVAARVDGDGGGTGGVRTDVDEIGIER